MAQIKASLDVKKNELTLVIPMQKPTLSKTEQTYMVATSNGFQTLEGIQVDGKPVRASINATIPNPDAPPKK